MGARDRIAKALLGAAKPEAPRPQYLRIGDWHPSETSRNYSAGKIEPGVSVYDLHPQTGRPVVPPEGEWAADDLASRLAGSEPKYLVEGQHVGIGHDGEPLLKQLQIIRDWTPDGR